MTTTAEFTEFEQHMAELKRMCARAVNEDKMLSDLEQMSAEELDKDFRLFGIR